MYQVVKKDGQIEDFDRNKIIRGVISAGGTAEEAEKIAVEIETWLPTVAVNEVVQSSDIRTKGLEVLRAVNPVVADTFESYKKQG